jgi:hypothetical protein
MILEHEHVRQLLSKLFIVPHYPVSIPLSTRTYSLLTYPLLPTLLSLSIFPLPPFPPIEWVTMTGFRSFVCGLGGGRGGGSVWFHVLSINRKKWNLHDDTDFGFGVSRDTTIGPFFHKNVFSKMACLWPSRLIPFFFKIDETRFASIFSPQLLTETL